VQLQSRPPGLVAEMFMAIHVADTLRSGLQWTSISYEYKPRARLSPIISKHYLANINADITVIS
jgi:hypothetical protein